MKTFQEMTQAELAKLAFVTPDAVHLWVRGKNTPKLDTLKQLSTIFSIPVQDLINDDLDIPEYIVIDHYLPYHLLALPKEDRDSEHTIIDAGLANRGMLHRYTNCVGEKCSAIYRGREECMCHTRDHEAEMISYWNKEFADD